MLTQEEVMLRKSLLTTAIFVFVAFCLFTPHTISANNEPTSKEITLIAPVVAGQSQRLSSRYEKPPADSEGLYYVQDAAERSAFIDSALVLSYDDKPIPPKENDPGAPTKPGFYLTGEKRFDFQKVEVIGKKVYFLTRSVGGVSYEFVGDFGSESLPPDFGSSMRIPIIAGTITTLKNGAPVNKDKVKFSHAFTA
jgi:hypothetical protein